MNTKLLLLLSLSICSLGYVSCSGNIFCYFGSWSVYTGGEGTFVIENFDASLCTHLLYAFAAVSTTDGSIQVYDEYADLELGGYRKLNGLKQTYPNLRTLLSVGGWNEGSSSFSQMVASPQRRTNFVNSAVNFMSTYGFDGVDIDWEYPGQREGSSPDDKENLVLLLRELRAEFDQHGYLITSAVSSAPAAESYDVPAFSELLDFINVMTYDFHGTWDSATGVNAPLYGNDGNNADSSVQAWINGGASPVKVNMGLAFYGHSFTLSDPSNHGIGAPVSGAGEGGPITNEAGTLGYNEICALQSQGGWTIEWSEEQQVPYAYKGNQWVGYDNPESIGIKMQYVREKNLAGVLIWSIETDDLRGTCGQPLELLRAVNNN